MRVASALWALVLLASLEPVMARDFRISHQWPAEIDARDRTARVFVEVVQSRLPGMSSQIHPQLSLKLKAAEQFDALQAGTLEMSVYALTYAVKKAPEFSLAALSGLYPSLEVARGT